MSQVIDASILTHFGNLEDPCDTRGKEQSSDFVAQCGQNPLVD
jgi:hypothetical protein